MTTRKRFLNTTTAALAAFASSPRLAPTTTIDRSLCPLCGKPASKGADASGVFDQDGRIFMHDACLDAAIYSDSPTYHETFFRMGRSDVGAFTLENGRVILMPFTLALDKRMHQAALRGEAVMLYHKARQHERFGI